MKKNAGPKQRPVARSRLSSSRMKTMANVAAVLAAAVEIAKASVVTRVALRRAPAQQASAAIVLRLREDRAVPCACVPMAIVRVARALRAPAAQVLAPRAQVVSVATVARRVRVVRAALAVVRVVPAVLVVPVVRVRLLHLIRMN